MSRKNLAKTHDEILLDLIEEFHREHPGGCRMEDVSKWALDSGRIPKPEITPERLLTTKLKRAARRKRVRDPQGREVRKWLAAKHERVDARGNVMLEVIWDQLNEMSVDHALLAFSQRDEIIGKQQRSATRDVQSFLDNNPNGKGRENQFRFAFMVDQPVEVVEEAIDESTMNKRDEAEYDTDGETGGPSLPR